MGLPKVRDQEAGGANPLAPTTINKSGGTGYYRYEFWVGSRVGEFALARAAGKAR